MKWASFFSFFLLVLAACMVIGSSQASAAIYRDNFRATINGVSHGSIGEHNPFGLTEDQTFNWYIVYDTSTITSGGFLPITSAEPANHFSVFIPRAGTTAQVFTEADDYWYSDGWVYAEVNGGSLVDLLYSGDQSMSPYTGIFTVDFSQRYLLSSSGTINVFSKFNFDPGFSGFDPSTDRQVVPLPGAIVLLSSGIVALAILKRKRHG